MRLFLFATTALSRISLFLSPLQGVRPMHLRNLLAAAAVAAFSVAAHADTIQTFVANGQFDDGAALGGTVTVDTTLGTVTSVDLTFGAPFNQSLTHVLNVSPDGLGVNFNIGTSGDEFLGELASPTLVGYTGGNFADGSAFDAGRLFTFLSYGSLEPETPTVTPEPSSLVLLGSGALGMAGIIRKRYMGA